MTQNIESPETPGGFKPLRVWRTCRAGLVAPRAGLLTLRTAMTFLNPGNVIELDGAHAAASTQPSELHRAECLRILAHEVIGRVIFTDAALPAVQPVS